MRILTPWSAISRLTITSNPLPIRQILGNGVCSRRRSCRTERSALARTVQFSKPPQQANRLAISETCSIIRSSSSAAVVSSAIYGTGYLENRGVGEGTSLTAVAEDTTKSKAKGRSSKSDNARNFSRGLRMRILPVFRDHTTYSSNDRLAACLFSRLSPARLFTWLRWVYGRQVGKRPR